jgi:hypothetical protein
LRAFAREVRLLACDLVPVQEISELMNLTANMVELLWL